MSKSQKKHHWYNRPILHEDHIQQLEHDAALGEFQDGLSREEAENAAYGKYVAEHHLAGAAHHLRGLRAAQASGDLDEAHKHGGMYAAHLHKLGLDPMDPVPAEINKLVEGDDIKPQYKYKSHNADQFLL